MHAFEHAPAWNRNHHDGGGGLFAPETRHVRAACVHQQQMLERARSSTRMPRIIEAQDARAQPADRPRRDLEHEHAVMVDPAFRVDRTMPQPERLRGPLHGQIDLVLGRRVDGRRRQIDRFFEERAVQWIRFVEQRERVELPARQESLDRVLPARNESLDEQLDRKSVV